MTARRLVRVLAYGGGVAAVVLLLGLGVFPTRTWLEQRAATTETSDRLDQLRERNEALLGRIEQLQSDEEIERLAREQYQLVYPGEEAYAILPPPLPEIRLPDLWLG